MLYPVAEKFISINGEGTKAGELAAFIRLKGCNLRCPYCDTKWAYMEDAPCEMLDERTLLLFVNGIANVTLTGGEPMLRDLAPLTDLLIKNGHSVEIETNGSVPIKELSQRTERPSFTMDYKLPSSNMESKMCLENFAYLNKSDTVKFVCGSEEDLERARYVTDKYSLAEKCHVYLSPVFGCIDAARMVEFMKENKMNKVRLQLQLHKYIWDPEKRGV